MTNIGKYTKRDFVSLNVLQLFINIDEILGWWVGLGAVGQKLNVVFCVGLCGGKHLF
ncbi:MAG: hypothetical protein QM669_09075 [Siphonobacter sp.]